MRLPWMPTRADSWLLRRHLPHVSGLDDQMVVYAKDYNTRSAHRETLRASLILASRLGLARLTRGGRCLWLGAAAGSLPGSGVPLVQEQDYTKDHHGDSPADPAPDLAEVK